MKKCNTLFAALVLTAITSLPASAAHIGQMGVHMLMDWGATTDTDIVNVWNVDLTNDVYTFTSTDVDGDGIPGAAMVDGPFIDFNTSFDLTLTPVGDGTYEQINYSGGFFSIYDLSGQSLGENSIRGTWDGVTHSEGNPNMTLAYFNIIWDTLQPTFHDITTYGPGTYSFDTDGQGAMLSMTVNAVPEPASLLLITTCLAGITGIRRKTQA